MIRAYQYIDTAHSKLHEYVMAYFVKIETDTNGFRDELFEPEFLPIVKSHYKILKSRFKEIYEYVSSLPTTDRHLFCQRIILSNQIEKICRGEYKPEAFISKSTDIDVTLKKLFLALYEQVLDGAPFRNYSKTTLRDHFNQFCELNIEITLCPTCGIGELKKSQDKIRDQYDHYLPKSLYPFSSINFYNLVPCCMECNSLGIKGDKDTIAISTGKIFFPYDDNHKEISLAINIKHDNSQFENIEWEIIFNSPDNKKDEIESWKTIYSIEDRYQGYIKARAKKWYEHYYEYINSVKLSGEDISVAKYYYMKFLEKDKSLGLNFIRKPVLDGFLSGSNIEQAKIEAMKYV